MQPSRTLLGLNNLKLTGLNFNRLGVSLFFLQRYSQHTKHIVMHTSYLTVTCFPHLQEYACVPKEFLLCQARKIKGRLGKFLYFKSVFNDLLFKLCVDLCENDFFLSKISAQIYSPFCSSRAANIWLAQWKFAAVLTVPLSKIDWELFLPSILLLE